MSDTIIFDELKKLPPLERLNIIEAALHQIRRDLEAVKEPLPVGGKQRQLAEAAEALLGDYASDKDLTAYTALDGDDFHA